ncbi:biopolymer transporter ExbD [Antarctobacter jejuensis]|uniref:biopolymer transporter ExbD n=1 Tax=Antarctobacter jejuensis TaxID=1439938 RepID=UPI003FD24AF3
MRRHKRRRRLSMTSLIDVIFLLLLFFMLSSTFTKFAEVELTAGGAGTGAFPASPPVFLRLEETGLTLNGTPHELTGLPRALGEHRPAGSGALPVIVALQEDVTAQRLTDLLVTVRAIQGLSITVLEAG